MTRLKTLLRQSLMMDIARGMAQTFRHLFHRPVTMQYPREKRTLPPGYRGMLSLLRYDDGTERCIGCALCEAACPSQVITVVSDEDPKTPLRRFAREYYMDMTRCVFCGFCVEACPVDALAMTQEYEFSAYNKRDLLFDKETLLAIGEKYVGRTGTRAPLEEKYLTWLGQATAAYPTKQRLS